MIKKVDGGEVKVYGSQICMNVVSELQQQNEQTQ